jgi:hypothetical protein
MKEDFVEYNEDDKTQFVDNPILLVRKSSTDLETLYLHKALKAPDSQKIKEAMLEELERHIQKKNRTLVLKIGLTENTIILPAVWAIDQKQRIHNLEVYK